MKANDVIVIGGGAAGLSAALFAARAGARVLMLEKNEKFGKKLYITGKGRCNLCNDCETEEFLRNVPRNPRFLYSALRFLSPKDLQALIPGSVYCKKLPDVTEYLRSIARPGDVILTVGAGDIFRAGEALLK